MPRISVGLRTGALAAAVTAGAVVAFGVRRGEPLGGFMQVGHALLRVPEGLVPRPWLAAATGLAIHVAGMLALGMVFAVLAGGAQSLRRLVTAAAVAGSAVLLVGPRLPVAFGATLAFADAGPQRLFLSALIAFALFAGEGVRGLSSRE